MGQPRTSRFRCSPELRPEALDERERKVALAPGLFATQKARPVYVGHPGAELCREKGVPLTTAAAPPNRQPRRRLTWIFVAVALVLASATAFWVVQQTKAKAVRAGSTIVLINGWNPIPTSGDDVGHRGTVTLIGGVCLGYRVEATNEDRLVVWPHGTEVRGSDGNVTVKVGGTILRPGDQIEFGIDGTESHASLDVPGDCRGDASVIRDPVLVGR